LCKRLTRGKRSCGTCRIASRNGRTNAALAFTGAAAPLFRSMARNAEIANDAKAAQAMARLLSLPPLLLYTE
jgi:hypothetical protein